MNLTLSQDDIETAVRIYINKMGINSTVESVNFSTARKGGFSIEAEVEIAPIQIANHSAVSTARSSGITMRRDSVQPVEDSPEEVTESKNTEPDGTDKPETAEESLSKALSKVATVLETEGNQEPGEPETAEEVTELPRNLFAN